MKTSLFIALAFWLLSTSWASSQQASPALEALERQVQEHLDEGSYEAAGSTALRAIELHRQQNPNDPLVSAEYAEELGIRFFDASDVAAFAPAIELLQLGLRIREATVPADDLSLADPLETLSVAYDLAGIGDPIAPQKRALAIRLTHGDAADPQVGLTRQGLGIAYAGRGLCAEAEAQFRLCIDIFQNAGDSVGVAESSNYLGEMCRIQNKYQEADTRFQTALDYARDVYPTGDPALANYLINYSGLFRDQSRYREAELLTEEAIRIRADLPEELAIPTLNLAELYRYQGRYDEAEQLYATALKLASQYQPPNVVAEFHNQFAALYADTERPAQAGEQFSRALALLDASPSSPIVVAQTRHDLATLLRESGSPRQAIGLYREALALREETLGPDNPLVALTLAGLARSGVSRRESLALLERADRILEESPAEPETHIEVLAARSEIRYEMGRRREAIEDLGRALRMVDELRPHRGGGNSERIAFMARYLDYYERMVNWQVDSNHPALALSFTERMRARVLADQLTASRVELAGDAPAEQLEPLRAQERDIAARLGSTEEQIAFVLRKPELSGEDQQNLRRLEKTREGLAEDYQRAYIRIRDLTSPSQVVEGSNTLIPGPKRIQKDLIGKNGLLLAYHVGRDRSYLFTVSQRRDRVNVHRLTVSEDAARVLGVPEGDLTRPTLRNVLSGEPVSDNETRRFGLIDQLRQPGRARIERGKFRLAPRFHALFQTLIPSHVWRRILDSELVTVIPHDVIHQLPFDALVVDATDDDVTFWLDAGPAIRYAPSVTSLALLQERETQRRERPHKVVSVSDPAYVVAERLPDSVQETRVIVSTYGEESTVVLQGTDASEERVTSALEKARVIHLATHGLVNTSGNALLASLTLAPESPESSRDGELQLYEIYKLRLNAELAILSSCDSNVGRYTAGEGVIALARGFLTAGADRVLASQWKVSDKSTAALVAYYFRVVAEMEYQPERINHPAALQFAKKVLRASAEYSDPYYWAAFGLSGLH